MNQFWLRKIPFLKELLDLLKMRSNLLNAGRIGTLTGADLDFSAVFLKFKVMNRLVLIKPHHRIAPLMLFVHRAILRMRRLNEKKERSSNQQTLKFSHDLSPLRFTKRFWRREGGNLRDSKSLAGLPEFP